MSCVPSPLRVTPERVSPVEPAEIVKSPVPIPDLKSTPVTITVGLTLAAAIVALLVAIVFAAAGITKLKTLLGFIGWSAKAEVLA